MRLGLIGLSVAACGGGPGNPGGHPEPLTANLSGAIGIGITKPTTTSPRVVPLEVDAGAPAALSTLVKIDSAGNVTEVLDQSRPVFNELVTSTHVIVSGDFHDIAAADGSPLNCSLIAIPKTAAGDPVVCLLQGDQLEVEAYALSTNGPHDKPGMAARGGDLYFVQSTFDGSKYGSELRHWAGGADTTEVLIHLNPGGGSLLFQPFVAETSSDLCVVSIGEGGGGSPSGGATFCGSTAASNWSDIGVSFNVLNGPAAIQIGHLLVGSAQGGSHNAIDLDTLVASDTVGGGPELWGRTARATDGSVFGIFGTGGGGLQLLDNTGTSTTVDSSVPWTRIIGRGAYAWVYGGSKLQRFDLAAKTLDATNYLGMTTFLQVTDMSFSSANRIRLDGTLANGQPGIVAIDIDTGAITVTTQDIPRLSQVTPLQ